MDYAGSKMALVYRLADPTGLLNQKPDDPQGRRAEAGVQAFVVHGNHDPLDGRISQTEALEGVTIFGADAEKRIVENCTHNINGTNESNCTNVTILVPRVVQQGNGTNASN